MPHATFLNLSLPKRQRIESILLETFHQQSLSQVKVSDIVAKMGMSRGAFYKYFENLEDANNHMITISAREIHRNIMEHIEGANDHLFQGISQFLLEMTQLSPKNPRRLMLTFLTKSDHLLISNRREEPEAPMMFTDWFDILAKSKLRIEDEAEAISFLYFIMAMVIQAWNDYIANDWDSNQLLVDFHYKEKWLREGLGLNNL